MKSSDSGGLSHVRFCNHGKNFRYYLAVYEKPLKDFEDGGYICTIKWPIPKNHTYMHTFHHE